MPVSNILIAGCGDVGLRLGLRLNDAGCKVWGMRRDSVKLPGCIQGIAADLAVKNHFPVLPKYLDAVVYCAAAGERSEEAYRRTYLLGLKNILHQIHTQNIPIKRFLFTSSTAVYQQSAGEWVDEDSATQPSSFSGRIMLEAEQCLAHSGLEYANVRFGGIYGPGRMQFLQSVREERVRVCENFPQYTNRIHSDDCAGVLQHLLQIDTLESSYVAVDCAPVSKQEASDWMAGELGVCLPARVEQGEIKGGQNKRCSNARLLQSGYQFLHPDYRVGYGELLGL